MINLYTTEQNVCSLVLSLGLRSVLSSLSYGEEQKMLERNTGRLEFEAAGTETWRD